MLDNIFQGDSPTVLKWKRKEPPSPEIERPSWRFYWWSSEQDFFRGFLATLCYSGSFLTFGMSAAVMGATLMELGCKTGRPLDKMSWVFFSQSFSALFGSILGGYLAERHNTNVVLLTCVTIVAVCLTAIPICSYSSMIFFFAILGFNMGIIDTVANVQLIKIHGKKVSPRLQTLHFFYGIGAILSPALSRPFLRDRCANGEVHSSLWSTNLQNSSLDSLTHSHVNQTHNVYFSGEGSVVQYAYWNVALMQIPVQFGLLFLIVQQILLQRRDPRARKKKVISLAGDEDEEPKEITQIFRAPEIPVEPSSSFLSVPIRVVLMTILGGLLLFLYDGLMGVFADFLVAYSRKGEVHFSAENSAYLDVVFWSLFAAGRFVSIFVAIFISPERMLIANLGGCFLSEFIMLAFHRSQVALWLGTSLVGLFMSSIFPSTLAFTETYIEVTGPVASCMVVTSAIGEMALPVGVGQMFSRYGPISFLATGFVVSVIAVCVYITIRLVARGGPSLNMPLSEFLAMVFCSLCSCGNDPHRGDYTKLVPDSPQQRCSMSEETAPSDEGVTVSQDEY